MYGLRREGIGPSCVVGASIVADVGVSRKLAASEASRDGKDARSLTRAALSPNTLVSQRGLHGGNS